MPFVWTIGYAKTDHIVLPQLAYSYRAIIGASLGGALADPVVNYPSLFSRGTIFEKFPFLLPNLVCAGVCLFSLLAGLLFLQETNDRAKHRRDIGLEVGRWLTGKIFPSKTLKSPQKLHEQDQGDRAALLWDEDKTNGYGTSRPSTQASVIASGATTPHAASLETDSTTPELSVVKAFNRQVVLNIICYGLIA